MFPDTSVAAVPQRSSNQGKSRMKYASRSSRLLGQFVDGLIALAPLVLLFLIRSDSQALSGVLTVGAIGWTLFHILLADGMAGGQSWGKQVAGTFVIPAT